VISPLGLGFKSHSPASGYKLGLCYKRKTIAPLQKKEKRGDCAGDVSTTNGCEIIP